MVIIRCDLDACDRSVRPPLPDAWLTVTQPGDGGERFHFCSWEHVADYAAGE